jgi:hypothetical protein
MRDAGMAASVVRPLFTTQPGSRIRTPPSPPGLKRYFHAKRGEGLLSPTGLRILDHACDRAIDCSGEPLVGHVPPRISQHGSALFAQGGLLLALAQRCGTSAASKATSAV